MRPKLVTESVYDRGTRVAVGEGETWLVRAGPRGGTPVVFLHGLPTSAYLYRNVIRAMHEEYDCIAFDWPGFGQSDAPADDAYTHRARADHLRALLDALAIDRASLVIHDVGGPAGLLFAVENPERIERLVILNTTVYKRDFRPPLPALTQFIPGVRGLVRPLFTRPVFDLMVRRGLARPDRLPRDVLDAHWRILRAGTGLHAVFESWAQMLDGTANLLTIRNAMATFPRPVLVLFGADDPFLPPTNAERFAKSFPQAHLELLARAGHFLQEDAPEEVAEHIARFLR